MTHSTRSVRFLSALTILLAAGAAHAVATQVPIIGEIERLELDPGGGTFGGGTIVVGGQNVIIPRNLIITLPANRLTLAQIFEQAPANCVGTSGLAKTDPCLRGSTGGIATILANRVASGNVIAGEIFIAKGVEAVTGDITFINFTDGYFRLNGIPGDDTTGVMVRINDPEGRHTVQQGKGCVVGTPNCSPDPRFALDPDNYTVSAVTGFPMCVPSTVVGGLRTRGADTLGRGDPLCPDTNRNAIPVPDATRFAPLKVGDNVFVEGAWEVVGGVRFLSVFKVQASLGLTTTEAANQPAYINIAESSWDLPGFANERVRFLLIGFTTLPDSQLDVFWHHLSTDGAIHDVPLGSTVGNPVTINQGIAPNPGGIFRIRYDVDFLAGVTPNLSPCTNLRNAGFVNACPLGPSIADEMKIIVPGAQELSAHVRRRIPLRAGITVLDASGNEATHDQYTLTPSGGTFVEFVEINLAALQTPFGFSGVPWLLDRRLTIGGCDGPCETTPQPLDPFPFEEMDPRLVGTIPPGAQNRIFAHFPFGPTDLTPWPPPAPAARPIVPTPGLPDLCTAPPAPPAAPTIGSMTPNSAFQGSAAVAAVSGTNFITGTTCTLGAGVLAACIVDSALGMTMLFQVAPDAAPGPRTLTVTGPGGVATLANAFTVLARPGGALAPPVPLTSDAGSVLRGASRNVALTGTGFDPAMTCDFGAGVTVTSCTATSATTAAAVVAVTSLAALGPRTLVVRNPDGQSGALANALTVIDLPPVLPPAPTLRAVTPNNANQGTSIVLVIDGANFQPNPTCNFGPGITVVDCTIVTSTTAIAAIEVATTAAPGPRDLVFVNADLQAATMTGAFTVNAPAPPPVAPGTILFSDNFNAADALDLGPLWTISGTWTRTAGRARGTSALGTAFATFPAPANQVVQVRVQLTGAGDASGPIVRSISSNTFYAAQARTDGTIEIVRFDAGVRTVLASEPSAMAAGAFNTVRLSATGTNPVQLQVSVNGLLIASANDASANRITTGLAGMLSGSTFRTQFDDFFLMTP